MVPPWDLAEVGRRSVFRKGDGLSRIKEHFDQNKILERNTTVMISNQLSRVAVLCCFCCTLWLLESEAEEVTSALPSAKQAACAGPWGESTRNWASPEGSSPLPSTGSSASAMGSSSPDQEDLCLVGLLSHTEHTWGEAIYPFFSIHASSLEKPVQSWTWHQERLEEYWQFSLGSFSNEPISHCCW